MEHDRQHDQVHDRNASSRENDAAGEEYVYETAFMWIQARCDEQPGLHDDPRHRDHDREDDAQLDLHEQEFGWAEHLDLLGVAPFLLDRLKWFQKYFHQSVTEHEENHGQRNGHQECVDKPLAEILKVVTQRHGVGLRIVRQIKHEGWAILLALSVLLGPYTEDLSDAWGV